jgi:hypothetical protein
MIHGISRRFQKKKKLKLGATFMNGKKEEMFGTELLQI